jgi:hypothetical protein
MRYILTLVVTLGLVLGLGFVALPSAAFASGDVLVCADSSIELCLRDPSDGGTGTPVLASAINANNSEVWSTITDTSRCRGVVTENPPCPFTDTNLDGQFEGKTIVVLKQETTGLCLRIPGATGLGVMGACDTGNEPSTAFVFDVLCSGSCNEYIAVDETNNRDFHEYLANDYPVQNKQVFGYPSTGIPQAVLWLLVPCSC